MKTIKLTDEQYLVAMLALNQRVEFINRRIESVQEMHDCEKKRDLLCEWNDDLRAVQEVKTAFANLA